MPQRARSGRIFAQLWALAAVLLCGAASAKQAVAVFDTSGVSGSIRFSQADPSQNVNISVQLEGLDFLPNAWHIHVFPVVDGCQASSTGGHFNPLNAPTPYDNCTLEDCELGDLSGKFGGFTTSTVNEEYEDPTLTMFGELSFIGRSVVIHKDDGDRYACATIQYDGEVKVVKATFSDPLIGYISMAQPVDDPAGDTWVMIDLRYADASAAATQAHNYHVHEAPYDWTTGGCDSTLGHYDSDPELLGVGCTTNSSEWDACELGDLSGKHGTLDIPSTGANKVFYTDTRLPLSGNSSVASRSITVHGANQTLDRLDCATTAKVAVAMFDMEGVTGYIEFMQASIQESTQISVHLQNLEFQPNPWHVHVFPVAGGCGSDITGGHFNPFDVPTPYDSCTFENCEVGDLSGKFGLFESPTVDAVYDDPTLDLHGENSIVGRSVVIHKDDTSRWVCATIQHPTDVFTYVARFANLFCGTYTFQQSKSDPTADTTVLIDVQPCESDTPASVQHNYHVHISPVDEDAADRCQSAGGHWNPYAVSLDNCSPGAEDWYYCEVGDLSGKHDPLDIPSTKGEKVLITDTNLPLSGAWSIADRSIVIHAENGGGSRDDCATLVKQGQPRVVTANFDMHGLTGYVRFTQASADDIVLIEVNLDGLQDGPNPWHIHEFPVADSCESDSTGGHFNPTGWDGYPVCEGENCEAGDLSGRHGMLITDGMVALYEDSNITLFGADAFAGRSIVIHKSDGSRWACATIGYPDDVKVVKATFEGEVQGTVTLTQTVDNPSSETTVLVQLKYSDVAATATKDHMYHVHQNPIDLDSEDRCGSAGGHWNPFTVSGAFCSPAPEDWASCEMGDLSGKHGLISLSSSVTKLFYVDTNLHLSGDYSVGGLSIVVHAADQGGARIACATLGKVARVYFEDTPVNGYIEFTQPSAHDNTKIVVKLSGLQFQPNPWHVHEFPVIDGCSSASVGGHYNPYNVPLGYTSCDDQRDCEVGDLSTKHGMFATSVVEATFMDRNLPLFGKDSVIGRSIVIHKSDEFGQERWVCGAILPAYDITTVEAEFEDGYQVKGVMIFKQISVDWQSDTWALIDVDHMKDSAAATNGHNYHVHESEPDFDDESSVCSSTGPHWNPLDVSSASCSTDPADWSMCEVADLSGKHGPLSIPGKLFITDTLLPLTGNLKIAGRSITIHAADGGAERYDCAELELEDDDEDEDDEDDDDDDDGLPGGAIAGIAVGVTAVLAGGGFAYHYFSQRGMAGYKAGTQLEMEGP